MDRSFTFEFSYSSAMCSLSEDSIIASPPSAAASSVAIWRRQHTQTKCIAPVHIWLLLGQYSWARTYARQFAFYSAISAILLENWPSNRKNEDYNFFALIFKISKLFLSMKSDQNSELLQLFTLRSSFFSL